MTDTMKRDGQDDIDASRAPLIEHLTELRTRLIYSLLAFFATFVVWFGRSSASSVPRTPS